jgi:hypothetical protein
MEHVNPLYSQLLLKQQRTPVQINVTPALLLPSGNTTPCDPHCHSSQQSFRQILHTEANDNDDDELRETTSFLLEDATSLTSLDDISPQQFEKPSML